MRIKDIKYPAYFNLDDVPIALELEGDKVVCKIANGKPFPVGKAIVGDYRITKIEVGRLPMNYYPVNIHITSSLIKPSNLSDSGAS